MQGEMTPNGTQFECIIDGETVTVYQRDGYYIGIKCNGEYLRLTEQQVIAGIQAKTAADWEKYKASSQPSIVVWSVDNGD